jgi:hypothetical protein
LSQDSPKMNETSKFLEMKNTRPILAGQQSWDKHTSMCRQANLQ